jgi:hypothetical protein
MSLMDENAKARELEEQAAITRQPSGPGARTSLAPPGESCEPAHDELGLLRGKAAGHRWDGWCRLTGDEAYFAACSCGWRSTETGCVSPMLRQVKEHLGAIRAIRGGRPSTRAAQAPARDERARDASQREMGPDERTRELYASVESQQGRLSQALEQSGDLLSASKDQADRFVAVLEYAAARVAPEWARTGASVRREQALQCQVERVKEWRAGIAAAAGALAAVAEEVALAGQDLETRYRTGSAHDGRLAGEAANRHGGRGVVAG